MLRVLLGLHCAFLSLAVDESNFRTCAQGSFCSRYRKFANAILEENGVGAPHVLLPDSVKQDGHILRASIASRHNSSLAPLLFEISFHKDGFAGRCGIVRFFLTESAPLLSRYQVPAGDVIVESLPADQVTVKVGEKETSIESGSEGSCSAIVSHDPFYVTLAVGGVPIQRINGRQLLNFERYRTRDSWGKAPKGAIVDATDVESKGAWEEKFKDFTDSKPRGPASVGVDVTFVNASYVTGLASHATGLQLQSEQYEGSEPYRMYNLDVFEYALDVPMALYGAIPFATALRQEGASGFLVVNPSESFVQVTSPKKGKEGDSETWWTFESGVLDAYVFLGPTNEAVLQQYHTATGLPRLPPLWALGKHQSRWNYQDVDDVLEVDSGFDQHLVPYDVLWLDVDHTHGKRYFTWHPIGFPDPERMTQGLERKGRKIVTIQDPHIKVDANYSVFAEFEKGDLLVRQAGGESFRGKCWPGESGYMDTTNPAARKLWAEQFAVERYKGSSVNVFTWNDMNEPSVFDGPEISMPRDNLHRLHDGNGSDAFVEHRDVHNIYGMYQQSASVMGQLMRNPEARTFVLTRAFFAGTHRHGPTWTGDNMGTWDHMERSVPMLLSLALCGLSFAGADVGGFFGNPDPELLVRWHQLGAWYPFYRAHAHLETKRREPWLFGSEKLRRIRSAVVARYALLPTWYTLFAEWAWRGLPVIRPLWWGRLKEKGAFKHEDTHFFVGEHILVRAPPVEREDLDHEEDDSMEAMMARARRKQVIPNEVTVYLPEGDWYDYWSPGPPLKGGKTIKLPWHQHHVPVFVKSGAILFTKQRPRRSTAAMSRDPHTIQIFGDAAVGRIYVDDGASFRFQEADFSYNKLIFKDGTLSSEPVGVVDGMPLGKGWTNAPGEALNVERISFVGLTSQPTGSSIGQLRTELLSDNKTWFAELKKPTITLGATGWTVTALKK